MPDKPSIEELANQIQTAVNHLPQHLDQNQVEALIMTIAQGYAPTPQIAVEVILNAAASLQAYLEVVEEAQRATKQ